MKNKVTTIHAQQVILRAAFVDMGRSSDPTCSFFLFLLIFSIHLFSHGFVEPQQSLWKECFGSGMTRVPRGEVPGYPVRTVSWDLGCKGVGMEAAISWGIVDSFC